MSRKVLTACKLNYKSKSSIDSLKLSIHSLEELLICKNIKTINYICN